MAESDIQVPGPEPEWELPVAPPPPGVDLDAGELLLVDWVLCGSSHILQANNLDELVARWHILRLNVWSGLKALADMDRRPSRTADPKVPKVVRYELTGEDAERLLALVPTTHRWGTGPDVGYALKMKLALFLGVSPLPDVAKPEPEKRVYLDD